MLCQSVGGNSFVYLWVCILFASVCLCLCVRVCLFLSCFCLFFIVCSFVFICLSIYGFFIFTY